MQSLVLPPSSFIATEFGHPRFNPGPERLPLNLPRSTNARRYPPRDLPLPRSMSGSVPADDPLETSGNTRRPGHPELPQPVTTVTATTSISAGLSGPVLPPGSTHEAVAQRMISASGNDTLRQPFSVGDTFPSSRLPPSLVGPGIPQAAAAAYAQPSFGTSPPGTTTRALPQKPTRRTKAHVASACVNCKKKHLGCDPARPCRRCVLSGKEATCVDVTHKKRGRPPLKAEEASLRTYAAHIDNRATAGEQHGPQSRRSLHRATSSREIRPMTDLQMPGGQAGAMAMRASAGHPQRWAASVYPQAIDPTITMQRGLGHRRFSSSGSAQSLAAASPPSFVPMPVGYNPALGAGRMPMGVGRPMSSYTHQGMNPATTPPQYQQPFVPISPYPESARMPNRMSMGESPMSRDPREGYLESPVRLPPIYPPTMGTPASASQGHRLSDPYPAAWSPRTREEFLQQEHRQQMASHGLIDPLSPNSQMRHAVSDFGYGEPIPRQFGPTGSAAERHSLHMSLVQSQDEPPANEADAEGNRPAKRRKMALDDMVND
ncbi:C6 transcription factor [Aspergillus sclerotioniger CBS 115572]|uniref:Transcription activator of gluconeogenesis acuK n=1 Tax=Aspergillus sclerotioniger CBS 115572 TaxID=1450535 RepID=A0A317XAM3_9EURO|nr:C6 transcription factor [Aspergillus sclerotioniger CBS 115572]PWY94682.1 C6 transcription factor [Aspergillus sclerotioniger CBS 115572]